MTPTEAQTIEALMEANPDLAKIVRWLEAGFDPWAAAADLKRYLIKVATLRESLAKAEGERDEALHMVATGAYAAALKAPPSSIYHHSLALTVEFFRKAEARASALQAQIEMLAGALGRIADHSKEMSTKTRSYGIGWAFFNVQGIARQALASLETKEQDHG